MIPILLPDSFGPPQQDITFIKVLVGTAILVGWMGIFGVLLVLREKIREKMNKQRNHLLLTQVRRNNT